MASSLSQVFFDMGGVVNPGSSNDELINHLIDAEFIRSQSVQYVFRSVDRAIYLNDKQRRAAYKDFSIKLDGLDLIILAPSIYAIVLEALELRPNQLFLNIGSGSGYLSTMAGLLLGQYGINHGIELHKKNVDYAYEKLEIFLKEAKAIDEIEFCEPEFSCGNCLTIDSNVQQYDRVYCGAACPEEYETHVKNLVKINGILVMVLKNKLLKMKRVDEDTFIPVKILKMTMEELVPPPMVEKGENVELAKLGNISPPTLQQLCRFKIRTVLKTNIENEHPQLKTNLEERDRLVGRFELRDSLQDDDGGGNNEVDLDSFRVLVRSVYGYQSMDNANPFGLEEEEFDVVSYFKSYLDSLDLPSEPAKDSSTSHSEQETVMSDDLREDYTSIDEEILEGNKETSNDPGSSFTNHLWSSEDIKRMQRRVENEMQRRIENEMKATTGSANSSDFKRKGNCQENKPCHHLNSMSPPKKKVAAELQHFSYSYYITQRITSLPLPVHLLRYLNYGRDNF